MAADSRKNSSPEKDPATLTLELLAAVDEGDVMKARRLLKAPGIDINGVNKHGESPLHIAAGYGRLHIVRMLHRNGAFIDSQDKQGDTPLYWASRHSHLDVVQYLCQEGATSNAQDKSGETALHVAAKYDHPEVLSYLCRAGANLDIQDSEGDTPLLCASWHGYQNVVECLTQAGCSLSLANREGETALHVAAVRGYSAIVRFLCQNGAQLDAMDRNGCSAVQLATRRNHLDIVQYLCEKGCSLNIQDCNGDTALHDACREGQLSLFYALYAAKCDLDLPNTNGATPLHLAAKYGHTELVRCLCTAGCNVNAVTEHGFTADEVAANSSHDDLATLIHHLRQDNLRDHYVNELVLGQIPISRVKLLVCGAPGVGKTELINSLKCHFLRSLFRRRSTSDLAHAILRRTHGIAVHQTGIPNAGDFSIWDFSGMKEYYMAHEHFLGTNNSVVLLVFSLREPVEKQIAQLRFWLAMIKSKQPPGEGIRFAGRRSHKPFAVLVGSFADQRRLPTLEEETSDVFAVPLASSMQRVPDNGRTVLQTLATEFGEFFHFPESVYTLDCRLSQTREIRALRSLLGDLRSKVLRTQPWVPPLVHTLVQELPHWRREHADLPVLTWGNYHSKTRDLVNPLVSEERMRIVMTALHDMGEVVYINEGPLGNIVILDPAWMGQQIFGPALSPENSVVPQLKSVTGRVGVSEIRRVYPEWDAVSILHLFQHFELCSPLDEEGTSYSFPGLIKMQPLFGLWEREPNLTVYAGIRLQCRDDRVDSFSPGLFSRIQVRIRRAFSDDIDDQELTLWSEGLKCCRGEVEVLVRLAEPSKVIEILTRGTKETRPECYALMQRFYFIVSEAVHETNPGTSTVTYIPSARHLKEHRKHPAMYSSAEVFGAERGDGVARHAVEEGDSDLEESILDLICCGCSDLLIAAKSAPYTPLRDLSQRTRAGLCRLLDPPDPLGRDWCLLALQLGMTEEVPAIDQADDGGSPTDKLLTAWERGVSGTVVNIVDALRGIGRTDAAHVLIEGISLFINANSSVVVNIPGVALTSYIC